MGLPRFPPLLRPCVLALVLGAAPAGRAQPVLPAPPVLTPAEARVDRDGDAVPDRLGQRVAVAGRALYRTPPGGHFNTALQADGAGITLAGDVAGLPIAEGDSVVATGTVRQQDGETFVRLDRYRVVPAAPRVPDPTPIRLDRPLEPHEGTLVELTATALAPRRIGVGYALLVQAADSTLYAVGFRDSTAAYFRGVRPGQPVRIVGVLGQFDGVAPYTTGYQIYPRRSADVRRLGPPVTWYRWIAVGVGLLLVVVVGWALHLQRVGRRRLLAQQRADRYYRLLFDNADEAILVHRASTRAPVILDANAAAARLLGYGGGSVRDLDPSGVLAEAEGYAAHAAAVAAEGRARSVLHVRRRDGAAVPVEVSTHVVPGGASPVALTIATDVSQRLAYEQGLIEARERAEAYGRLQATFVANMSHEIRTPLAGIIGFAEVLREELHGDHRHFAELIEGGGRRLLDLLNAILDHARLDAGGLRLSPDACDLTAEVQGALDLLQPVASARGVDLRAALDGPLPGHCDAHALRQIVYNLTGNALKFTPSGGVVRVGLHRRADALELVIEDTGVGIAEAFLPHLFEPFTQESSGYARTHEGVGLGLSITRRLVDLMGGTLDVTTARAGEGDGTASGTTFRVRLPLALAESVPPSPTV